MELFMFIKGIRPMKKIIITEEMLNALMLQETIEASGCGDLTLDEGFFPNFNNLRGAFSKMKNKLSDIGNTISTITGRRITGEMPKANTALPKPSLKGGLPTFTTKPDFKPQTARPVGNNLPTRSNPTKSQGFQAPIADGASQEGLNLISKFETGKDFGYKMSQKDLYGYNLGESHGKKTYGYGLLYHPSGKFMQDIKAVWTQPELEQLFVQSVNKKAEAVKKWAAQNGVRLGQHQIDAMTSACYNFGPGFLKRDICRLIAENPNNPRIPEVWANLSNKQGARFPGLIRRRKAEAELYSRDLRS